MRLTIGYAKNEMYELIFGNILMICGGAIFNSLSWVGILLIVIGICFDTRVLLKFNKDLSDTKQSIHSAKMELEQAESTLKSTIKELKEQEKKLEEMRKKIFSFISDVRMHPLEEMMKEGFKNSNTEIGKLRKETDKIKDFLKKSFGLHIW